MQARAALHWSVWAWLAQWGTIAFLAFHPAVAAAVLLVSAPFALALLRMAPAKVRSIAGLGRVTVPLLALPAVVLLLRPGAGLSLAFPSFWLHAPGAPHAGFQDSTRALALLVAVLMVVALGYVHRSASRLVAQPVLSPASALVGASLALFIAIQVFQLGHPVWGGLYMALHVILAVHLIRASGDSVWGTHTPFLAWTCIVTAATLIDGKTAEEPNLAVPLVAALLPVTVGTAAWRLWKEGVYWPALVPLGAVAAATAIVAADYVVRWLVPTGTAIGPGSTAVLNLIGLAYPCAAWLALRTVIHEWRRDATLPAPGPSPA